MANEEDRFEGVEEVAERLLVDPQTVRRWIKSGKLKAYKPGREYRILSSDLDEFLEARSFPKAQAPLPEAEQGRRDARTLRDYVAKRVEWCEQVMEKAEGDFNYPFSSLDTAIQWAMYVGVESVQLSDFITHGGGEDNQDLRALVDRLVSVSERTDARVKVMMEDAALNAEEREQVNLRLVQGQRSA